MSALFLSLSANVVFRLSIKNDRLSVIFIIYALNLVLPIVDVLIIYVLC